MGIVSFLGRIGSMIAPFTATMVRFLCLSVYTHTHTRTHNFIHLLKRQHNYTQKMKVKT